MYVWARQGSFAFSSSTPSTTSFLQTKIDHIVLLYMCMMIKVLVIYILNDLKGHTHKISLLSTET